MSLYLILFILDFRKLLLALSSGLLSQPLILRSRCNQPFCDGKRQLPILYDVTIMAVSCFSYIHIQTNGKQHLCLGNTYT